MSASPYLPPTSPVADPPEPDAPARPVAVTFAAVLIALEIVLYLVSSSLTELMGTSSDMPLYFFLATACVFTAIYGMLIYHLCRGRNWARFVLLALLLLSVLSMFTYPDNESPHVWLDWSAIGCDCIAMVLVFGPARAWFRRGTETV